VTQLMLLHFRHLPLSQAFRILFCNPRSPNVKLLLSAKGASEPDDASSVPAAGAEGNGPEARGVGGGPEAGAGGGGPEAGEAGTSTSAQGAGAGTSAQGAGGSTEAGGAGGGPDAGEAGDGTSAEGAGGDNEEDEDELEDEVIFSKGEDPNFLGRPRRLLF
jgi:hypothetical protein